MVIYWVSALKEIQTENMVFMWRGAVERLTLSQKPGSDAEIFT